MLWIKVVMNESLYSYPFFQFRTQRTKYWQIACRIAGVMSLVLIFLSRYEKFPETSFIVFRCFRLSCFLFSGKRNTISLLLNKTHLPAAVVILNNKPTPFKAGIVTSFAFMPLARVTCGNYATRVPNVVIYGFYKSF